MKGRGVISAKDCASGSNSQKALSTVAIRAPQLHLVTFCKSLKDIWDKLQKHMEQETLTNKPFLKRNTFTRRSKKAYTTFKGTTKGYLKS